MHFPFWLIPVGAILFFVFLFMASYMLQARRERAIRTFIFPSSVFSKLVEKHPQLSLGDCQLAARALRTFFLANLKSGARVVGMPSRVVDDLWHEFILHTRAYNRFCIDAFGRYFHHTPAAAMGANQAEDLGLRVTWRQACLEENINPRTPTRLPLLFAIDSKLKIERGYAYSLDRMRTRESTAGAGVNGGCGGSGYACSGGGLIGDSGGACSGSDGGSSCSGGCGGGGGD